MLNSAENEICSSYKKLNTKNLNFFFLHSKDEHEFFPANKYQNANNPWSTQLSMKEVLLPRPPYWNWESISEIQIEDG